MTAQEINAARRSLSAFKAEFAKFTGWAGNAGKSAAKAFGRNWKSIATFTIREFARGALPALGQRIVENWGRTGTRAGRTFGRRMRRAAKAETDTMAKGMASGGMRLNLGSLPVIGAAALAALAAGQMKSALDAAFQQERLTISLDALSVDGRGGSRLFEAMRQEALKTGVGVAAQASTVQKMMAQGIAEGDALQLNRAMLDIAGGTGLATHEIELLGTALAQVKGKGVAAMEELRGQIAEKGVPIFEALRQRFGKEDVKEVFDAVSAGKVTADDVLDTFKNLEGPFARFLGAAERLGQTGGGLVSRLKQEMTDLRRVFMTDVLPELKPVLETAIGLVQRMKEGAKELGTDLAEAIGRAQAAFESLSLTEMLQLAGLALKERLLEALDAGARGVAAIVSVLGEDDTFVRMMQRAAAEFKSAMLLGLAEVARGIEQMLPDTMKTRGLKLMAGAAANRMEIGGNIAADDAERFSRGGALSFGEMLARVRDEFKKMPSTFGFSEADAMRAEELLSRIEEQRAATLASRGPDAPIVEPAAPGGVGPKSPYDPTAMLAGGLANAIGRITGGGDILLTKQLATQEGTRAAAEKTAAEAKRTADAVEQLVKHTNPRNRTRDAQARLVL